MDLNIDIKTENGELYFLIECKTNSIVSGYENEQATITDDNKWIKPLKRIELLYPSKHSFDVYSENGTINLLLVIEAGKTSSFINKQKEEFVLI